MASWRALGEIGFDGPVMVEPFTADIPVLPPPEGGAAVTASFAEVWPG
jgi:hypothetical protein